MKKWKKAALKSAHSSQIQWTEGKPDAQNDEGYRRDIPFGRSENQNLAPDLSLPENAGTPAESRPIAAEGERGFQKEEAGDPMDEILSEMAAYLDHKFQEECEAVQREMAGVEIPPRLEKKLRKMAADKERREAFFGNRRRMRAVSAVCALFLIFAAGAGILASPQSEHLRSELYALLSGSDDTGDSMNSDAMDSRVSEDGDDEDSDRPGRGDEMSEGKDTHAQDKSGETIYREGTAEKNSPSASHRSDEEYLEKADLPQENSSQSGSESSAGDPSDDPSVPESPAGGSGGGSGRPGTNGWDSSSAAGISDFPADLEQVYYPDYLPEGYRRAYVSAGDCVEIIFENSESQNLMTLQYYPKGFDFYEAAAKNGKNISVNGSKAILYHRNPLNIGAGQTVLYWDRGETSIRIQCAAGSLSDSELLRVAESIALKTADSIS